MKMKDIRVDMKVTTTEEVPGYYSGYAGRPKFSFKPGMVGTVATVRTPAVYRKRGEADEFCCVDWECPETNQLERCALYARQIQEIKL